MKGLIDIDEKKANAVFQSDCPRFPEMMIKN